MKNIINKYDVFIFDLDGTLYFMRHMKLMLFFHLFNKYKFSKYWQLKLVRDYRNLRKDKKIIFNDNFESKIIESLSDKYNIKSVITKTIIHNIIIKEPLPFIKKSKDEYLLNLINEIKNKGKIVIVYSDYPTEKKLEALGISDVWQLYPGVNQIIKLKPNYEGLSSFLKSKNYIDKNIIYFGDEKDKDGKIAEKLGVYFFYVKKIKFWRKKQWGITNG